MKLTSSCLAAAVFVALLFTLASSLLAQERVLGRRIATQAINTGAVNYDDWAHTGSVWILTTPDGANLPAEAIVEGFPLLVRLHRDYFDFRHAQADGQDLRFASSSGEPLAYQIEDWDSANGVANVWVRVPKVLGNTRQELKLHWGNPAAASESDGKAVFNESNGYLSVWHMYDPVRDDVGYLDSTDTGTEATAGVIGAARHWPGGKGVFGGDKISNYPTGATAHSSEAWFRAETPNSTILGWGNEQAQGKVVMQFRSPPHVQMDCYFSGGNVTGGSLIRMGDWTHVVHTYRQGESKIYVNGVLDGTNPGQSSPLAIKSPARLWIGGWYNNYNFVGDLDEVRISHVVRSADWIKLQYANQKPNQLLVGPVVQPGSEFSVSHSRLAVAEGQSVTVTAKAGGSQQVTWILNRGGRESIVATNRFSYTFDAGRVTTLPESPRYKHRDQEANSDRDLAPKLSFRAVYPNEVKSTVIPITISDDIPEPDFTLSAPMTWDGRQTIEVVPRINNLAEMRNRGEGNLNFVWSVDKVAVIKQVAADKLILKRAQASGNLVVTVAIDNGGAKVVRSVTINVLEPPSSQDPWVLRPLTGDELPEDNQFVACDGHGPTGERRGTLACAGTLREAADSVFLRAYADDRLVANETRTPTADNTYTVSVKLTPALVKYRIEFGSKSGDHETILHRASNIVCGDAYIINGQSNAVATDFGKDNPIVASDWVRTFGATDGSPQGSRLKLWANAQARSPGGKSEIGYWGMELGRRLVASEKIPICIINGAVGGTRIDQHQRSDIDPNDARTIYGRLLWRVQQARLTHGIRAVIWHQGENDQAADGPTGGYGHETYRQYFVDLAAAWKEDYPNIQRYYVFQIWPKSCAMGINGSDNRLREVQRTLPNLFSNLSVMSTVGVKPPGGCHFPAAGYVEFARMLSPLIEYQLYHRPVAGPMTPPNLKRAWFTGDTREELTLEFDSEIVWSAALTSQFHLDGEPKHVESGAAIGKHLTLKLKTASSARTVTYLDSANWNPDNLLYGMNGLAALTFCEVPIENCEPAR